MNTLIAAAFVVFALVALAACSPTPRRAEAEVKATQYQPTYQGDKRSNKVLRELKECWKTEVQNPDQCVIAKGIAI